MQERHRGGEHQDVVVIGGAAHEGAGALNVVADLETEAVGEEGPGDLVVGGAEHGVAELAGHDRFGAQHARGALPGAFVAAGAVVPGGGDGTLLHAAGDLEHGAGPGGLLDRANAGRLAAHVDAQPGQVGGGAGQVVGVVHADVQLDQPPGGSVDDPQLTAGVAGGEPAVAVGGQPEFGVVGGGAGDVRHAHGDRGQAVQGHWRRLSFAGWSAGGDEPVPEFADALDAADELVAGGEPALRGAAQADPGRGPGEDDVAGQQRQRGGQPGD